MTDLERARKMLDDFGIEYIYSERDNSQGNESSYFRITLPEIGSKHYQTWFFINQVGGKAHDKGKTKGQFDTTDYGHFDDIWWGIGDPQSPSTKNID